MAEDPTTRPRQCSFCSQALEWSKFTVMTRDKNGAICQECIGRFSVVWQLHRAFLTYHGDRPWDSVKDGILRSLAGEDGPDHLKKAVAELAFRLAQRSAAICCNTKPLGSLGSEQVDPKTKTFLTRPRIAVIGKGAISAGRLLEATSQPPRGTGIPVHICTAESVRNGDADSELYRKSILDPRFLKCALLFVMDGYVPSNAECAIAYCCETDKGLPPEVHVLNVEPPSLEGKEDNPGIKD